jgi:hypothetical protein
LPACKREAFAQGSESDEAIYPFFVAVDCFAEFIIGRRLAPTRSDE